MKLVCAPPDHPLHGAASGDLHVVLYGRADHPGMGSVGAAVKQVLHRNRLQPTARAWDLLSIALSVTAADVGAARAASADGWTRQLELCVAVCEPAFWASQKALLERQLRFLTTDIWQLRFTDGGLLPDSRKAPAPPEGDSVVLLSGGLDSLVGTLDLVVAAGRRPYAVSQITRGDGEKQALFARSIGGGLQHLQLNHNAQCPGQAERSQRARSLVFLTYAVVAATCLQRYQSGEGATLYVCENGFISVNPPLTDARLGSLTTRTTHPVFLALFQQLLDAAGLTVRVETPYQFRTKGEMLIECADQKFLKDHAHESTSCGRFSRYSYKHCGRCVPCLVRRAAFRRWGVADRTRYVYADLGRNDDDHARFDDVRAVAMAVAQVETEGLDAWLGSTLAPLPGDPLAYSETVRRGLGELAQLLEAAGVQ